jgi:hypothetical protein
MKYRKFSATLMAFGLLAAAPAFAQTTPVKKQPTQEGGVSGAPAVKQPTQEGGVSGMAVKQPTQEGGVSGMAVKQPTQEGGVSGMAVKQPTQNLTPSSAQADALKQK